MLRLRLWNNAETTQYDVDLYENAPINLNYRFTDVSQVNKSKGSFSQTFRVPATKSNLDFFGGIINPDVRERNGLLNTTWNVKKKVRAELAYKTIPIMDGSVQLKRVVRQKKQYYDLELVFFGESVDIAQSIGQKKLSDLTLTSVDHDVTVTNIVTSWFETGSFPLNGDVKYGIMDKGSNWSGEIWTSSDPLKQAELTPYLRAYYILERIFTEAGFSISSTFLNTDAFQDIYMPLFSGGPDLLKSDDFGDNTFAAGLVSNQTTTNSSTGVILEIVETVDGGSDPSNNFNSSTHKYTAPANVLVFYEAFTIVSQGTTKLIHTTGGVETILVDLNPSTQLNGFEFNSVFMESGSTLHLQLFADSGVVATASGEDQAFGSGSYLRLVQVNDPISGFELDTALNMPDFKQIDFVSSLQKMFNLVFIPDALDPSTIKIEPFQDFVASGTKKDWTSKLDFTSDIVIEPTADIQFAKYKFTHAEGGDFLNDAIQRGLDRVYGEMEILDLENDFSRGDYLTQDGFAPHTMSLIPDNPYPVHRCIQANGAGVAKPKPRLAYWNGLSSQYPSYQLRQDNGSPGSGSLFPVFSNYSDVIPTVSSLDLNYGFEFPMIPSAGHPFNTLYQTYWAGLVNELYSSDARMLTCKMLLTSQDIQDFQFSDQIYIEGTYYRVLEITGFDATRVAPCSVKLIKILTNIADCDDTPTGVDSSGNVTFNNSATDFGSRECCEKYGYIFKPDKAGGNPRCTTAGAFIPPSS
tara:strand:+ start:413 stop:2659 length:2247 start_codon:yes stop_codon:yes gene_type:complete